MTNSIRVVVLAAALGLSAPAFSDPVGPGVSDLTRADADAIRVGDIVEALAVSRGLRVRPATAPRVLLPLYFEFGTARPTPESRRLLEHLSLALRSEDLAPYRFSIVGHTDSIGTEAFNQKLSARRAELVHRYVSGRGVDARRLETAARGESEPLAPNDTEQGRQRNRRVEIVNLGPGRAS